LCLRTQRGQAALQRNLGVELRRFLEHVGAFTHVLTSSCSNPYLLLM